jgi:hypothetical protein
VAAAAAITTQLPRWFLCCPCECFPSASDVLRLPLLLSPLLLQGQPKGRLLKYDPDTKETHVLATVSAT